MGNKFHNDINYQVVKMSFKKGCLGISYCHHEWEKQKRLLRSEEEFSNAVYELLQSGKTFKVRGG